MPDRGISPKTTNTVDLGSASKKWRKMYAGRIDEGTYIPGAFNKKETFTSSGTFTAPVTGVYRITLQGGGGGGSGAGYGNQSAISMTGAGGGSGGHYEIYEALTAGTSYSYTIGAGGSGGAAGSSSANGSNGNNGGPTIITIGDNTYKASGGFGGRDQNDYARAGNGGFAYINDVMQITGHGFCGETGTPGTKSVPNSPGGGAGANYSSATNAKNGAGGFGGHINYLSGYIDGGAGGDGYITFEYYDPTL